jgi:hypothetical protein
MIYNLDMHCMVSLVNSQQKLSLLVEVYSLINPISGVMVSVLASSVVDCEPQSCQTKDYKIGTFCICCFSTKHAALRR